MPVSRLETAKLGRDSVAIRQNENPDSESRVERAGSDESTGKGAEEKRDQPNSTKIFPRGTVMYFDAEMVFIYTVAILSGVIFYAVASRDPRPDNAGESSANLCDSQ